MRRRAVDDSMAVCLLARTTPADVLNLTGPTATGLLTRLAAGPLSLSDIDTLPDNQLPEAYFSLQTLWGRRAIELRDRMHDPLLALTATVTGQALDLAAVTSGGRWKLSRFAYVHRDDGALQVESPRAFSLVRLLSPGAMSLLACFDQPVDSAAARERFKESSEAHWKNALHLLRAAAVIVECNEEGDSNEDLQPDLLQWSFHDLLFHHRSRQGRHELPLGADFRFRGKLAHEPVVKTNPWRARAIVLDKPDPASVAMRVSSQLPPPAAILARTSWHSCCACWAARGSWSWSRAH